jgi:hypothetical protein
VPDQTARDAIGRALRQVGVTYYGVAADAVLAALGIPPDTTTDDLRAALTLLDSMTRTWTEGGPSSLNTSGAYVVNAAGRGWAYGASPAAAVNALAAKLKASDG